MYSLFLPSTGSLHFFILTVSPSLSCSNSLQSCPTLCNPWTVARQASLTMEFSSQEYWPGLLFPSSRDLPDPGIEPVSPEAPALQTDYR